MRLLWMIPNFAFLGWICWMFGTGRWTVRKPSRNNGSECQHVGKGFDGEVYVCKDCGRTWEGDDGV